MDYEKLDAIADAYIPLLAILFLISVGYRFYSDRSQWWHNASISFLLFCLILISYIFMFADNAMQIWSRFGLDYSTHTAISLALVFVLCVLYPKRIMILAATFVGYVALMLYQKYHSIADILTTSGIILTITIPLHKKIICVEAHA